MKTEINCRVRKTAQHIIENKCTIREAAIYANVSKSTVHKDMSKILPQIDFAQYEKVKEILDINLSERHIRGGIFTKNKWEEANNE